MKEVLVSYELALLLKEINFDWKTIYHYYFDGTLGSSKSDGRPVYHDWNEPALDHTGGLVSAPTLSHVQQWFREIENIAIDPVLDYTESGSDPLTWWVECILNINCADANVWTGIDGTLDKFSKYEEALEAGLLGMAKRLKEKQL